jgi:hypothetical protein
VTDDAYWNALPLRQFHPRSSLQVQQHDVPRAYTPAIDAHYHLGKWHTGDWAVPDAGKFVAMLDERNVATVVNLDGMWGDELEANLDRYDRAFPGRFVTFCRPDWSLCAGGGDWSESLADGVRESIGRGARGIKIAKELGLRVPDESGTIILPDDPRLDPLWSVAAELHVPVLIHTADPVAFFEPMDEHNERLEEMLDHPDWRFADPPFPRMPALLQSLRNTVEKHRRTTFIGAHVGCYSENLAWVAEMLRQYPNFYVDIGARIDELGRQPRTARRLFMNFPDRILFATDTSPDYPVYFRCLETDDDYFPYHDTSDPGDSGRWHIYGLDLPRAVLYRVYYDNARKLIGGLPAQPGLAS